MNNVLNLHKGTVIVLLEPMNSGYLRLFDTIIIYVVIFNGNIQYSGCLLISADFFDYSLDILVEII